MSTEFRTQDTDEFAFIRWAGAGCSETGADGARNGAAFEFGCASRAFAVRAAASEGRIFVGEQGEEFGQADVERIFSRDRATFGQFGGTVEVDGSGEFFTRTTESAFD